MSHLSDEQLQALALNEVPVGHEPDEAHLRDCASCRAQLKIYKALNANLAKMPFETAEGRSADIDFPAEFAESVVERIEVARRNRSELFEQFLFGISLLAGSVLVLIVTNVGQHASGLYAKFLRPLLNSFDQSLPTPESAGMVAMAFIMLAMIALFDRFLRRWRHHLTH